MTMTITKSTTVELLKALYDSAKANNSDGVLSNTNLLSLNGVSNSVMNRVLVLSSFGEIEDIVFTIQSMLDEVAPAEILRIPQL